METLYVYRLGEAVDAAEAAGDALGLQPELRNSSYYGGNCYRVGGELGQVIVLENSMEDDDEPLFETQPVGTICVQVSGFAEARERLEQVPGLEPVDAA